MSDFIQSITTLFNLDLFILLSFRKYLIESIISFVFHTLTEDESFISCICKI